MFCNLNVIFISFVSEYIAKDYFGLPYWQSGVIVSNKFSACSIYT